jgi:hypothetical protein
VNHEPEIERCVVKDLLYIGILQQGHQPSGPTTAHADDGHAHVLSEDLASPEVVMTPVQPRGFHVPGHAPSSRKGSRKLIR